MKTITSNDIAQWAKQFFPHLLPDYGRACIEAILKSKVAKVAGAAAVALSLSFNASGQVDIPGITNLPVAASLTAERFGLSQGAVTDGDNARSATIVDASFFDAFFVRGEVQIHNSDNVVANLGIGAGFYKAWESAKVYGFMEGRRNYMIEKWEGIIGLGIAWRPVENGVLSKFSLFTEPRLVTDFKFSTPPGRELVGGIRYSF